MTDWALRCRMVVSGVVLSLLIAGLGVRLVYLHLGWVRNVKIPPSNYTATILAGRGLVQDCRGTGNALAMNLVVKDVCANPRVVVSSNKVTAAAVSLSDMLDLPVDELADRLNHPDRKFTFIKRYVPEEEALKVLQLKLPGVELRDTIIRHYPHRTFMCHVLGFVNYEGTGSSGVEQGMDQYLRGSPGMVESLKDGKGIEIYIRRKRRIPAVEGANVTLTLDQNIQYMVEKAIEEVMVTHQAKGAWAIVERVKTGEILALASQPTFDPNQFQNADENCRLNRPVGYTYEPGSTFKVIAISGALNEGIVQPDTEFDCENGAWDYAGKVLKDVHGYGILPVADIVKKSSNIGTAKIALGLGKRRYYDYLKRYGLGARTGIDLPGEEVGILRSPDTWGDVDLTRMAMGQSISVTAIQVVNLFCAIANDGFLMRPYCVKKVSRGNGEVLYQGQPEVIGRPISQQTVRTMRDMLRRVTDDDGTGKKARVEGFSVAGKTGTGQIAVRGGFSKTDYMASFVGFLPAEDPEIAIIVVVDSPHPEYYGGVVAAPVFSVIAGQAVRYLDIPPSRMEVASSR